LPVRRIPCDDPDAIGVRDPPPGNMSYDHRMRRRASDYAAAAVFLATGKK